jgi:hypothetical protein
MLNPLGKLYMVLGLVDDVFPVFTSEVISMHLLHVPTVECVVLSSFTWKVGLSFS